MSYVIEGKEVVTNALSFNLQGRNNLEDSVEQFYFGSRGALRHFYKGFQVSVKYNFYKMTKVKIPFHKNDHHELINESFQYLTKKNQNVFGEMKRLKKINSLRFVVFLEPVLPLVANTKNDLQMFNQFVRS